MPSRYEVGTDGTCTCMYMYAQLCECSSGPPCFLTLTIFQQVFIFLAVFPDSFPISTCTLYQAPNPM